MHKGPFQRELSCSNGARDEAVVLSAVGPILRRRHTIGGRRAKQTDDVCPVSGESPVITTTRSGDITHMVWHFPVTACHIPETGAIMGSGQREQGRLRVGDNQMPPPFG